MPSPDAELLQALEDTTRQVQALTDFARELVGIIERREQPSERELAEYPANLDSIDQYRARLDDRIANLWTIIGTETH